MTARWPWRSWLAPDDCRTLQQNDVYYHRDLAERSDADLQEEYRFRASRVFVTPIDSWQRERVRRIEEELQRRRAGVRT